MEVKAYELGDVILQYVISEEGKVAMLLLPKDATAEEARNWELGPGGWDVRGEYNRDWRLGYLVQLHLRHHNRSRGNGLTEKYSESTENL